MSKVGEKYVRTEDFKRHMSWVASGWPKFALQAAVYWGYLEGRAERRQNVVADAEAHRSLELSFSRAGSFAVGWTAALTVVVVLKSWGVFW